MIGLKKSFDKGWVGGWGQPYTIFGIFYEAPNISKLVLPSWPEFRRCSPRSQPNTRSFIMPVRFRVARVGRDVKNVRRNEISFPLFRSTGSDTES